MTYKYEGELQFTTDRKLTEAELNQLFGAIQLQIEEPTDADGNDEQFKTSLITVKLGVMMIKDSESSDSVWAQFQRQEALSEMISTINSIEPLTLGELREATKGLPDDVQILIGPLPVSYADWFNASKEIVIPDLTRDDSEYSAVTLFPVDTYDSRQF